MNQNPLENKKPKQEQKSMGEKEAKDFLEKNGGVPLDLGKWETGESVIIVFTDLIIEKMNESEERRPKRGIPKNMMPCIVRMDKPVKMYLSGLSGKTVALENTGGQVDYYSINSETGEITCVKSSANFRGALEPYLAAVGNIYKSMDLFPKQAIPINPYEK
jgi:hypothetical protein